MESSLLYLPTISNGKTALFLTSRTLGTLHLIAVVIYRPILSSLAGFPGPKLLPLQAYMRFTMMAGYKGNIFSRSKSALKYDLHTLYGLLTAKVILMNVLVTPIIRVYVFESAVHDPEIHDENLCL